MNFLFLFHIIEPSHSSDHPEPNQTTHVEDGTHQHKDKDDSQQFSNGKVSDSEKGIDHEKHPIESTQSDESPLTETETAPQIQGDPPKKTFASVVSKIYSLIVIAELKILNCLVYIIVFVPGACIEEE